MKVERYDTDECETIAVLQTNEVDLKCKIKLLFNYVKWASDISPALSLIR